MLGSDRSHHSERSLRKTSELEGAFTGASARGRRPVPGALLSILQDGKPAPGAIGGFNLVDDDEGRLERFLEHVEQQLAGTFNQRSLFLRRDRLGTRTGAFTGDLDGDDGHVRCPCWGVRAAAGAGASSVAGALAAVDVKGLPGDEGGVFQKQDRVDDVSDFSHASDWMQVRKELVSFGSMHRRLDDTGSNGVNPDALLCVLDRQGLRGGAQSAFGQ